MATDLPTLTTLANSTGDSGFYDKLTTQPAGWVAIIIASVCFGTNLVPVKKFNMGDGITFQWIMCSGILLVGVIVQVLVGTLYRVPEFYPLAMFGGALWATGNSLTVIIIECIGLGLGILLWSMANMLFGFATSHFGWYGINRKIPSRPALNYAGVAIAALSIALYAAIKPNNTKKEKDEESGEEEQEEGFRCGSCFCPPISQLPPVVKRIMGIILALVAGSFYGHNFVPTIYIQNHYPGASQNGLDYVFAQFVGIWMASTVIFVIYALFKKNKPWWPAPNAMLPALLSGILWGLAQSSWFIANAALQEPIAFPIITTCPAVIATLLGVFLFKEISGKKNFIILGVAIALTICGVLLNAFAV